MPSIIRDRAATLHSTPAAGGGPLYPTLGGLIASQHDTKLSGPRRRQNIEFLLNLLIVDMERAALPLSGPNVICVT